MKRIEGRRACSWIGSRVAEGDWGAGWIGSTRTAGGAGGPCAPTPPLMSMGMGWAGTGSTAAAGGEAVAEMDLSLKL